MAKNGDAKKEMDTKKGNLAKESSSSKKARNVKKVEQNNDFVDIDVSEIKSELTEYMQIKIDKEISNAMEKANKKLLRHKNSIIFRKNIIIIILLIVCFFLGYNLYSLSNINIDISTTKKSEKVTNETKEVQKEEDTEFEDLKDKYGHLVTNIYINEDSSYLEDYYKGNLTDEIKLYISLNNIENDKVLSEDGGSYLDEGDLKKAYNDIFEGEFAPKSFKYDDLSFRYLSSKSLFISDGEFTKSKSAIAKDIIDINEKEGSLEISTVEGLIKDGKLYNILSLKEIKDYKSDSLSNYEKSLTKLVYYFNKVGDDYKLSKIVVE